MEREEDPIVQLFSYFRAGYGLPKGGIWGLPYGVAQRLLLLMNAAAEEDGRGHPGR